MPSMFRFKKRGRLPFIAGDMIFGGDARLDFSQSLLDPANTDGGIIKGGTSTAPLVEDTADYKFISLYFDDGATSGDARGIYNRLYITGAGGGGESLRTYTTVSNVAGTTAHGGHISLDFAATGSITGLGVASRNTLHIPDAALGGGTYAATMVEIFSDGASSSPATATKLSFLRFANDGNAAGIATVEDKAFLFEIAGGTSATDNMVYGATARVDVLGSTKYLIFSTAQNALTISGVAITAGAGSFTTMGLSDALTFSDGATIDNTDTNTLTITEDNIIIAGNLQVDGTTTTVNTATLTVDDKNIELGATATPTDTTADGGGITLKGATDKTIIWDNANDNWTFNQAVNLVTGLDFKINNVSVLNATTLGSSVVSSSLTSVGTLGALTVVGAATIDGGAATALDIGTSVTGIDFTGTYTGNVIDFSNATIAPTGGDGPCLIRGGTYDVPIDLGADEDQSGMVRLYSTTQANGTSYDRVIFACAKTTGTKGVFSVSGLAEVLAQSGDGPAQTGAAQFIAHMNSTTAKIGARSGHGWANFYGAWFKIASELGSATNASSVIAPIWLDSQMNGTVGGEHYSCFVTANTAVDAVFGFENAASGSWTNLFYFDNSAASSAPISNSSLKVLVDTTQYYIPMSTANDSFTTAYGITFSAAQDIVVPANTAVALEFFDSTTAFIAIDTRIATDEMSNITITGMPATFASAANTTHRLLNLAPGTTTLTGQVASPTAMEGLGIYIAQPVVTDSDIITLGRASTVYIASSPGAADAAVMTESVALCIGATTTGIDIISADTGINIGTCGDYGILMDDTYTNAIRITTNVATTAYTGIRLLNTYTGADGYHVGIMGAAIWNPTAASGYGAVIGVYGEANIQGNFTGGTNWSFGVRGTLQLTDDTVINNGTSIFGAINASMKDDATPILTAGHICGIYIENLIDADLSAITGISSLLYMANNASATCTIDSGIYLYGPKVTYFAQLYDCTVSGCIAASAGAGSGLYIKFDVDGTPYKVELLADL